jgi:nucleotide-binding universal stress UspA family protein
MLPQIKKILYTTDLSPNAGYVLRYAINSAKKHDAKLVFLHVLEELPRSAKALVESYIDDVDLEKIRKNKIAFAKDKILKRIQELCKKELNNDPKAEEIFDTIQLVEGYPADEILSKADKFNCDAIIMGNHGKGFLKHAYFGSTSKKVLRRTRKPVFIIPLPE